MLPKMTKTLPNFRESSSNSIKDRGVYAFYAIYCNQVTTCTKETQKLEQIC